MMRRFSLPVAILVFMSVFAANLPVFARPASVTIQGTSNTHNWMRPRFSPNDALYNKYGQKLPEPGTGGMKTQVQPTEQQVEYARSKEMLNVEEVLPTFFEDDELMIPMDTWLEAFDFNGEGSWPEIVALSSPYDNPLRDNHLFTLHHTTGVSYTETYSISTPLEWGNSLESCDMNGDGIEDVGVGFGYNMEDSRHRFGLLMGPGYTEGYLQVAGNNPYGVECVQSGGLNTMFTSNWNSTFASVYSWQDGEVVQQRIDSPRAGFNRFQRVDIDADGDEDVAVMWGQLIPNPAITFFTNNGDMTFTRGASVPQFPILDTWTGKMRETVPDGFVVGRFNGDPIPEVIMFTGGNAGVVVLYDLVGGKWIAEKAWYGWGLSVVDNAFADDVDSDGDLDMVVQYAGADVVVYPAYSPGVFGQYKVHQARFEGSWFYSDGTRLHDMNGDGRKDFVFANYNYGMVIRLATGHSEPPPVVQRQKTWLPQIMRGDGCIQLIPGQGYKMTDALGQPAPNGGEIINLPEFCVSTDREIKVRLAGSADGSASYRVDDQLWLSGFQVEDYSGPGCQTLDEPQGARWTQTLQPGTHTFVWQIKDDCRVVVGSSALYLVVDEAT